jgi:hypothetical protein
MTSLSLTTVSSSQINKEATINTIFGQIEDRLIDTTTITMSDTTSSYTLTSANQTRAYRILCAQDGGDPPSAARDLLFTNIPGMYVVENNCGQNVNIKISTTTYYVLATGKQVLLYNTGSAIKVLAVSGATIPATIGIYHKGTPSDNEVFWGFIFTEAMTLPAALAGSQFRADVAPSGGGVGFTLHKNGGSSLGTITFADASNTATVSFATATSFAAGDRLEIIAPADNHSIGELFISLLFNKKVTE